MSEHSMTLMFLVHGRRSYVANFPDRTTAAPNHEACDAWKCQRSEVGSKVGGHTSEKRQVVSYSAGSRGGKFMYRSLLTKYIVCSDMKPFFYIC